MDAHAVIAASRFGLGARPRELTQIRPDPRGWLRSQLSETRTPRLLAKLPPSSDSVRTFGDMRGSKGEAREAFNMQMRDAFRKEMALRSQTAATTDAPFVERLVHFWSNHFSVSISRSEVRGVVGAFEREVVRKNLNGSFAGMLLTATKHPAMQLYLDNVRSIGPNSDAGRRSGRGLNENHAREILELHTMGVGSGYSQQDVEALAAMLTGWGLLRGRDELPGGFQFDPRRHEPGPKTFLGRTYIATGQAEAELALTAIATTPATARFVCTKLARHFVSDQPPASAVDKLVSVFEDSQGDLPSLHNALINLDEAWERPFTKLRTPEDLVYATARALDYTQDGDPLVKSMVYLGQVPFQAPSPQGWPDVAPDWLGPEAVLTRVEWAEKVASDAVGKVASALDFGTDLLGDTLSGRTQAALTSAPNATHAMALLLASPEMQRR